MTTPQFSRRPCSLLAASSVAEPNDDAERETEITQHGDLCDEGVDAARSGRLRRHDRHGDAALAT